MVVLDLGFGGCVQGFGFQWFWLPGLGLLGFRFAFVLALGDFEFRTPVARSKALSPELPTPHTTTLRAWELAERPIYPLKDTTEVWENYSAHFPSNKKDDFILRFQGFGHRVAKCSEVHCLCNKRVLWVSFRIVEFGFPERLGTFRAGRASKNSVPYEVPEGHRVASRNSSKVLWSESPDSAIRGVVFSHKPPVIRASRTSGVQDLGVWGWVASERTPSACTVRLSEP